ncbi:MAG: PhzF family phenazine biosynthesis protein [Vicinamibacteria bacterium]|nr:PhzF family phenazine biosynthesis protein [Vicinamibacteria bacterium]
MRYRTVNVFTHGSGRLTGNPLCVFEDAAALDTGQMQALALQFNLSETCFVTRSNKADARLRIFAPTYEMPFAGHPTLGAAYVVKALQDLPSHVSLELNVGVIRVTTDGSVLELRANPATHRAPRASPATFASALGLTESDLSGHPLWVNTGTEQLIVPLANAEAVRGMRVSYDLLSQATADSARPNAYAFAETGAGSLLSRYFFSRSGAMVEDPATGSATANLGGWYLANNTPLPLTLSIFQGEMTGRPSSLRLRIDESRNIYVAGEVIEVGRGEFEI